MRLAGEARPVLYDLDVALEPGHAIGVSGRSGTGKTTLIHAIAGLVPWLRPNISLTASVAWTVPTIPGNTPSTPASAQLGTESGGGGSG